MQTKSLAQLAKHVNGKVIGDGKIKIKAVLGLEDAGPGDISFLANKKYETQLKTTQASAVIVAKEFESQAALLVAEDPYYAFMQIVVLFYGHRKHPFTDISKKAAIAKTATVGRDCKISDFVTISENAQIGNNCVFYPGVFIGPDVHIGDNCIFYPNVVVYDGCQIGNSVIIQANATIGEDGYGFATHKGVHHKIPQVGRVILEDDVEIGAGCGIERGALGETIISQGSKIGDMVGIGHGAKIGPHCLLVPQVGIAGSSSLGHHCVIGGQVGIAGHIKLGDRVQVGAKSGISNNIPDGKVVLGIPAMDAGLTRRIYGTLQYLPDMRKKIKAFEKRIAELEKLLDEK